MKKTESRCHLTHLQKVGVHGSTLSFIMQIPTSFLRISSERSLIEGGVLLAVLFFY